MKYAITFSSEPNLTFTLSLPLLYGTLQGLLHSLSSICSHKSTTQCSGSVLVCINSHLQSRWPHREIKTSICFAVVKPLHIFHLFSIPTCLCWSPIQLSWGQSGVSSSCQFVRLCFNKLKKLTLCASKFHEQL